MSKSTLLEVEKVSIFGHTSYKSLKAEVAREKADELKASKQRAKAIQSFKSKLQPTKNRKLTIKAPKPQSGYNPWR